jgi:hypothetical protein
MHLSLCALQSHGASETWWGSFKNERHSAYQFQDLAFKAWVPQQQLTSKREFNGTFFAAFSGDCDQSGDRSLAHR